MFVFLYVMLLFFFVTLALLSLLHFFPFCCLMQSLETLLMGISNHISDEWQCSAGGLVGNQPIWHSLSGTRCLSDEAVQDVHHLLYAGDLTPQCLVQGVW